MKRTVPLNEHQTLLNGKSQQQAQNLCGNLGRLAKENGVTQVEIAEYAGWKKSTLSRMFAGKHPSQVNAIFYILNAINEIKGTNYSLKDIDVPPPPNEPIFLG